LREVIELPLTNPELFVRVGIKVSGRHKIKFKLFLVGVLISLV